ncbi:hypothetical protein FXV77_12270 [Sphingobacterium phlebotomi]|uniref:PH (Pleckstrin Homology) domain-containing protein n=1 Tax=Sphingobacterium phlebotomi TaxID=2605433 RepID=A0A5D4H5Q5_9SPHI|nr:hypothetical protein [Sphingobacterium phlebotomi]TYR35844.1 hypothetical protein FXV77_12270 [Sphingobacterium phlebotomi]
MSTRKYNEIQYAWLNTVLLVIVLVCFTVSFLRGTGSNPIDRHGFIIIGAILLISLLSFYRLKISIYDKTIHLVYGIGLIHIKLRPESIKEIRAVKTSVLAGWGIRFTMDGMLYNVKGRKAVRCIYGTKKTKTARIGTSNPEKLIQAIRVEFLDSQQ